MVADDLAMQGARASTVIVPDIDFVILEYSSFSTIRVLMH